ncbi:hypothetical protein [Mycobacterium phage Fezzik]|nr:hypothetical protein [Mycobacterium phage Fezzik]
MRPGWLAALLAALAPRLALARGTQPSSIFAVRICLCAHVSLGPVRPVAPAGPGR